MGTLPRQKTPGRYIDGRLWENLEFLSKKIVNDMTFLVFVFSSTLEVGTGKSVFSQQLCEAYLEAVRQNHDIDNRLELKNIVFTPDDLIERSFKVPKYSCVILDEWEDNHYFSKLGMSLREFFRRCRQLNLFMVCIIPNLFQLPKGYAISRSIAAIDVKFDNNLDRGNFEFYGFTKKKKLFNFGKKREDYSVVKSDFKGRFLDGFVVDEQKYKKKKYDDLSRNDDEKNPTPKEVKKKVVLDFMANIENEEDFKKINKRKIAECFGFTYNTLYNWEKEKKEKVKNEELNKDITITYMDNNQNRNKLAALLENLKK